MKLKSAEPTLENILENIQNYHPSDIATQLKKSVKKNKQEFYNFLDKIPHNYLGEVLLELPDSSRTKAYKSLSSKQIALGINSLETDDATDIIQDIEQFDQEKAKTVLSFLDKETQKNINWLKKYNTTKAGAYMQTELFSASLQESVHESIQRFKLLKQNNKLENIHQVFIVDSHHKLVAAIALEDLLTYDFHLKYQEILETNSEKSFHSFQITAEDSISDVVKLFENYNLTVVAVTDQQNHLVGRITSDDILDIIEESATEQIYQLAGVNEEYEENEKLLHTGKKRASWLLLNLMTAILASMVIGVFDETLKEYIALAILMPIVASMGGNAGTQTLAVMVRQLALGNIDEQSAQDAVKKEVLLSLFNGTLFAFALGFVAYLWFQDGMLGVVIALSMVITLFCAGFFGATIPLVLKKFKIDPAIGSTVILTTVTDIMGFFSFLALAQYLLM